MGSLIEWNEELSVGIEEIDEQHKILVNLLNKLHQAIKEHHGSEACSGILNELIDYTVIHFAVEESLMRILDYPGYEEHFKSHKHLVDEVSNLKKKVDSGHTKISFELLHFLKTWLTQHIMGDDKDYVPWFLERGIKSSWSKKSWIGKIWDAI